MTNVKAKTIQLLLYDGTLNGVINIADSAWNPGEMYASPRNSINELVSLDKYGVYLLLSDDRVYVGQAQDLERRIKQHVTGKSWWERVVLLTTKDDSFTRTDIDYLESVLIGKANKAKSLDSDNKNKGNNPKVDKFRKVNLDQYLDEALFLMELIGITVFGADRKKRSAKSKKQIITISSKNTSNVSSYGTKPELPSEDLKVGAYVKVAMKNLQECGYQFSQDQIDQFGSVEGSKKYTTRNLPLFWLLDKNESREEVPFNIRRRYWKDEFIFGDYRFLMYSQWYPDNGHGATRNEFNAWYSSLD